MGKAMRRYWLPFMNSADLVEGDDPHGVELMGERFVAWRDNRGCAGLFHQSCLHRGASMRLARAEGDGLRCIYHGWKFSVDGTVIDTPNVADPNFKSRIKGRTFPVREAGGLLWAYLGPRESEPAFPHWPWMDLSDAQRLITRHVEECSFVQVIEGLVDSSHLGVLHMNGLQQSGEVDLGFAQKVNSMQRNLAPRLEVQDTDFGFYYAALRDIDDEHGPRTEARIAAFVAPCCVLNPNGDIATFVVPLDDVRTSFIHVFWSDTQELNREPLRSRHLEFIGLTPEVLDGFGLTDDTLGRTDRPNPRNNFHQDREAMRLGTSWSGLPGLIEEDVAASVSAGAVRDRRHEMLSAADIGISRLYRTLLGCADAVERGEPPLGIARGVNWSQVQGRHGLMTSEDWRDLIARRKDPETEGAS
ncbi:Rieske 2Fe-2S domain-containing protein [Acidovorax sp. 100]|uniref:Rieske 2Fe-2S domain-containing protein n=1 Tax=Acidovorax sp. 100 TaxID=2135635 RepID=UPI0013141704|nr:Rieske 2Fe-2S domain-containing protein [Acidovorax sp. 100]